MARICSIVERGEASPACTTSWSSSGEHGSSPTRHAGHQHASGDACFAPAGNIACTRIKYGGRGHVGAAPQPVLAWAAARLRPRCRPSKCVSPHTNPRPSNDRSVPLWGLCRGCKVARVCRRQRMYTPPSSPDALQLKPTHAPRAVLAGGHVLRRSPGPRAADRRPSGASAGRTPADARAPMEPTGGRCGWCACSSRGLETELFLPALLDTHLSNGGHPRERI